MPIKNGDRVTGVLKPDQFDAATGTFPRNAWVGLDPEFRGVDSAGYNRIDLYVRSGQLATGLKPGDRVSGTVGENPAATTPKLKLFGEAFSLLVEDPTATPVAAPAAPAPAAATDAEPGIPQLTSDPISLGNGEWLDTFALYNADKVAIPGEITIIQSRKIRWRMHGEALWNRANVITIPLVGTKTMVEFKVEKRTKGRVQVDGFEVEADMDFPDATYEIRTPLATDPLIDHFFSGWSTGREDSRAISRVVFANIVLLLFIINGLVGSYFWKTFPLVLIGNALLWALALGFTLLRGSKESKQKRARMVGALPWLFMGTNNRWFASMFLMLVVVLVLWFATPSAPDMTRPRGMDRIQQQMDERQASKEAGGPRLSLREQALKAQREQEQAYADRNWFGKWVEPKTTDPELVAKVRSFTLLAFLFMTGIYFFVAIYDEVKSIYRSVRRRFDTQLEGETAPPASLKDRVKGFFSGKSAAGAIAHAAPLMFPNSFVLSLVWEVFTGALADKTADMLPVIGSWKRRRRS